MVEIVIDKNRKGPNPDWLKFAKTHHARQKIKDATRGALKKWFAKVIPGRKKKEQEGETAA
jgi:(p)ppGpp synthase/HD superfamily hydrolase